MASPCWEANNNAGMIGKIVERAIKSLTSHGVTVDRDYWLKEAEMAEKNEPPAITVCREIVRVTVGVGVEDEDRKRTWKAGERRPIHNNSRVFFFGLFWREYCNRLN